MSVFRCEMCGRRYTNKEFMKLKRYKEDVTIGTKEVPVCKCGASSWGAGMVLL